MSYLKLTQYPYDENGKGHGERITYYTNGRINYRENWVHGVLHGLDEWYHINGRLGHRGNWNMGVKIGYWYYINDPKIYYLCLI